MYLYRTIHVIYNNLEDDIIVYIQVLISLITCIKCMHLMLSKARCTIENIIILKNVIISLSIIHIHSVSFLRAGQPYSPTSIFDIMVV